MDFLELGSPIFAVAYVLSGSMMMLYFETINPKILPSVTAKIDFFGFNEIQYFLHLSQNYLRANR